MNVVTKTIDLGDGRPVTIETGKLAKQAHGSVVVRQGDTMLLAAAVSNHDMSEGVDFLLLTVDYREKYASTGRFPGGFFKREARPSDTEVLVMRLVDRALRPTFPEDYHAETQVMIQLMSADKVNMPDSLGRTCRFAALAVSDIPFDGPISEVRVARIGGEFVINPTYEQLEEADIDMMIAGSMDNVVSWWKGRCTRCPKRKWSAPLKRPTPPSRCSVRSSSTWPPKSGFFAQASTSTSTTTA